MGLNLIKQHKGKKEEADYKVVDLESPNRCYKELLGIGGMISDGGETTNGSSSLNN